MVSQRGKSHNQTYCGVVMIKFCNGCKENKPFALFTPDIRKKDGLTSRCKSCRAASKRLRYSKDPKRYRGYGFTLEQRRDWWNKTLDKRKEYRKKWASENKDRIAAYARKQRQSNPHARILSSLRGRLNDALHRSKSKKSISVMQLIGCSIEIFKQHLENQFEPEMHWSNYGRSEGCWQIDHIRPCSDFDLTDVNQQQKCFHFSNMRPLWKTENLARAKGQFRNKKTR